MAYFLLKEVKIKRMGLKIDLSYVKIDWFNGEVYANPSNL